MTSSTPEAGSSSTHTNPIPSQTRFASQSRHDGAAPLLGGSFAASHLERNSGSDDSDADEINLDDLELGADFYEKERRDGQRHQRGESAAPGLLGYLLRLAPAPVRQWVQRLTFLRVELYEICRLILRQFFILLLGLSLPIGGLLYYVRGLPRRVTVPSRAKSLAKEVLRDLEGTAIPPYVLTYAPYVLLDDAESFFPEDLSTIFKHVYPAANFTSLKHEDQTPHHLKLKNLDHLNDFGGGQDVYLTAKKDLSRTPKYLHGTKPGRKSLQTKDAKSSVIIVRDLGQGVVHAFYMYFYIYNKGPVVRGKEWENHLGDWEHNMIRFEDGEPKSIWYSQHIGGRAYAWNATRRLTGRPISYAALGTHANYIGSGWQDLHQHNPKIPKGIAFDRTSAGRLWDPTLSAYYYTYDYDAPSIDRPHLFTPISQDDPVSYLYFNGHWGDKRYPNTDTRQVNFHGVVKWDSGPQGPISKDLNRTRVCRVETAPCEILGG